MALNIVWTDRSLSNLNNIKRYLNKNWSERELRIFLKALDEKLTFITIQPEAFPLSSYRKDVRKAVLTKEVSIFYSIKSDYIRTITLWDNRQNPARMRL
jgi:plasmid stabilization system protein ParE